MTEEYIDKKRTEIIDAAVTIFRKKPLYEMTMLDVIKEAGLSKGGIYRYFNDIDDVIVKMINRETHENQYKNNIYTMMSSDNTCDVVIHELLMLLGKHINESPDIVGKIQFELTVLQANHPQRANLIAGRLTESEHGQYLVESLFQQILKGIATGEFKPVTPVEDIFTYIRVYIEGLVKVVVLERCYGYKTRDVEPEKMMVMLSQTLLSLLKIQRIGLSIR